MIAAWILYALVVGTLLGGGALALERVLRTHGLPSRGLWMGSMLLSVGWPLAHWLWRRFPSAPSPLAPPTGLPAPAAPRAVLPSLPVDPIAVSVPPESVLRLLDGPILVGWGLATGLLLLFFLLLFLRTQRLRRDWLRGELEGRTVFLSDEWGPAVVGFLRPQIVLPEWCRDMEERARLFIIDHELEHIRAGDLRLIVLAGILPVLFPWHLPVWWQLSRLRTAVEGDCDLRVLGKDPERTGPYLQLLLEVGARASRHRALATMLSEPYATLKRRIRIMTMPVPRNPWIGGGLLAAAGLLLVSLACWAPGPTDAANRRGEAPAATPAPTAASLAARSNRPVFTPYTVQPGIANRDEVRAALADGYPPLLRDAGIGGTVEVSYYIDEEGVVQRTMVNRSSGHKALDDAALRVADRIRFTPALNRDQKRAVWVALPVVFTPGVEGAAAGSEATSPALARGGVSGSLGAGNAAQAATASGNPGEIAGVVTSAATGGHVAFVQVYLPGTGLGTLTNAEGRFLIQGIPPGEWDVVAELIGYEEGVVRVAVPEGEAAVASFTLSLMAVPLEPLIVGGGGG